MNHTVIKAAALALGAALVASPLLAQAEGANPGKERKPGIGGRMHRFGGQRAEAGLARMAQHLNLTAEQQAKIKPVLEAGRAQAQAVFQDQSLSREQKREKLKAIHEQSRAQVAAVLTEEQKTKLAQAAANRRQGMGRGMRGHGGQQMAQVLNLTAEQQAQLKPVFEAAREQSRAVFQDQGLTREQKQAKLQQIRQETQAKLDAVLTAEQKEKLNQLRQQRPVRRAPQAAPAQI
ncbi:MAG: hypothetical protein ACK47B_21440 [Armatimonadota bacterium]